MPGGRSLEITYMIGRISVGVQFRVGAWPSVDPYFYAISSDSPFALFEIVRDNCTIFRDRAKQADDLKRS
jgi:hypothetical protein